MPYIKILQTPRTDWVLNWPGQVVLAGCSAYWATGVTEALEKKQLPELFKETIIPQLDDLRQLVNKDISKIGRMTLSALIVIEVHARDVITKMLENNVENVNDFEWISQLRLVAACFHDCTAGCAGSCYDWLIISLLEDKIFDWSKLKQIADDILKCA